MSISTEALLGRYAIAQNNYYENKKKPLAGINVIGKIKNPIKRINVRMGPSLTGKETDSEKLINITEGSNQNLISATTIFPFVMFPDTISIDRQKLTITHRSFFSTSSTSSVQIDDVQIAKVDVGPFFGAVHLASKYFVDNIQSIRYLRRADAIMIQRLLQGYMIAHHRKIDCSSIDNEQLVILLNDLGQSATS